MIRYKDLNITILEHLSPQTIELMNNHELCNITTIIVKGTLVWFLIYFTYKITINETTNK